MEFPAKEFALDNSCVHVFIDEYVSKMLMLHIRFFRLKEMLRRIPRLLEFFFGGVKPKIML